MSKICNNCHTENEDNANFCRSCGKDMIIQNQNVCPKCGETIEENSSFCRKCGYEFKYKIDDKVVSTHDYVKNSFNNAQDNVDKFHKSFGKIGFIVIIVITIILAICFYSEMGPLVLIFPALAAISFGIFYVKERIRTKIMFGASNTFNDIFNKKR